MKCNKESLHFDNLKEEIIIEISQEKANILSIDIYGIPPKHPDSHLGYWNFKIPDNKKAEILIKVNFNQIGFNSIKPFCNDAILYYKDFWINKDVKFDDKLKFSIVLWDNDKLIEIKEFQIVLNHSNQSRLQDALKKIKHLDECEAYINHFCVDKISLPQLLVIESTSRCNLKCPMCPRTINKSPTGKFDDLDEEILYNLENAIKNCNSVCLSWMGEPLVNKRLEHIIEKIKAINKEVVITITSNGILLSEDRISNLIKSGLDSINFSIDSNNIELYNKMRVGGDLEKVKNNIKNLNSIKTNQLSSKPRTNIAFVGGEENINQMPEIVNMANELGIKSISLALIDDFTLTSDYVDRVTFSEELKKKGHEAFFNAEKIAKEKGIDLNFEMPIQFFNFLDINRWGYEAEKILFNNDLNDEEIKSLHLHKGCHIPWVHSFIAHNGDVHPCCVSPRVLGNLKEKTFEEIWNGLKYKEFRKRLKSYNPNEECRRCKRAIWNRIETVENLRDWMKVGGYETHGLSWGTMQIDNTGRQYRFICKKATLFLRNTYKPYISLMLGNESLNIVSAKIAVNNKIIGQVVIPFGWKTVYLSLPDNKKNKFGKSLYSESSADLKNNKHSDMPQTDSAPTFENEVNILKLDIILNSNKHLLKINNVKLLTEKEVSGIKKFSANLSNTKVSLILSLLYAHLFYLISFPKKLYKKIRSILSLLKTR